MSDEAPPVEKMYCFLSSERLCGPDCMAFITFPKRSNSSELSDLQSSCAILSGIDRLGRNITILASTLVDKTKRDKTKAQDEERDRNTPKVGLPPPIGSPFPVGRK